MEVIARNGDTLSYYSRLFMIPLQLLADSNQQSAKDALKKGDCIHIPGFQAETLQLKTGDALWKIAGSRNISVDCLLLLNQNTNINELQTGDEMIAPKRIMERLVNARKKYDFQSLQNDLEILKENYPFIQINTLGKSVLGNEIQEIRIGRGSKKVHMNGSFHANEWITSAILMSYVNDFLLAITNGGKINNIDTLPIYRNVDLSLVPMVNPDGVDLVLNGPPEHMRSKVIAINEGSTDFTGWKANINGVDLNNQFPAFWEIEKERKEPKTPAPRDYPGDAPLTEPEAVIMAQLANQEKFNRMIAFHTQGKEFYWGYENFEPSESALIANEFSRLSGYKAVQNVDSHAGYKDWFIQEFRQPGFTLELGKGINPLPLSQFDDIYKDVLGIFVASLYL
ncbi:MULTISPECIES: M14 family metallopeptidase [unclassified Niallia]|uniref:M14 family metallopeptidase n=1 Tax=unclassified Niallia TaxID=2837522 RepID=UPI001EDA9E65|nr:MULTISPECIES: M14 family metallopeptidase [unclassified Niallia]MDL0436608.1 M14 family metallopeptidase [Niallia sp. SS-2023]UPO86562.1 M14 family metallopeptidase [Niallia sp. Man26]